MRFSPKPGPPLLPTPELTRDELESFLDSLLERLQRLPGANPRLTSSYRHGRRGDDQEGIDHYGTYDDGSTRVVPDILANESLLRVAVRGGRDSGYVDQLWAAFGNRATGVLVRNLADLDLRVRSTGVGPDLFTRIWADIEREVIAADATGRHGGLSLLRDLAGPQPRRVVDLVEMLISEPAVPVERSPGYHVTDDDVRAGLAPILSICATTGAVVRDKALDLLWALARNDHRPTNQYPDHPLRILADFAEFDRPGYNERQRALLEGNQSGPLLICGVSVLASGL